MIHQTLHLTEYVDDVLVTLHAVILYAFINCWFSKFLSLPKFGVNWPNIYNINSCIESWQMAGTLIDA
jgi:hypothetical protein